MHVPTHRFTRGRQALQDSGSGSTDIDLGLTPMGGKLRTRGSLVVFEHGGTTPVGEYLFGSDLPDGVWVSS